MTLVYALVRVDVRQFFKGARSLRDGTPADAMCDGDGQLAIKVWWSEESIANETEGLQRHTSRLQW